MPLPEIRELHARTGQTKVALLDDYQVRIVSQSLPRSVSSLRQISDVRALLLFSSQSGSGRRESFDGDSRRLLSPPTEVFGAGAQKTAFRMPVVFRVQR
jgi:hypothetical protein